MAAFGTELGRRRHPASAIAATRCQRGGTLLTKPRLVGVFMLAFRAIHYRPRARGEPDGIPEVNVAGEQQQANPRGDSPIGGRNLAANAPRDTMEHSMGDGGLEETHHARER